MTVLRVGPVRDFGFLNTAALRLQTTLMGQGIYPSTVIKTVALLESLMKDYVLTDGNKHLVWAACSVSLSLSALEIWEIVSNGDVYELVIVAAPFDVTFKHVYIALSERMVTHP